MIILTLFILFLLLENLFLPALFGPDQFFITPIFIIGLLAYSKSLKTWIFQAVILVLLEVILTGIGIEKIVPPLILTAVVFTIMNRYFNLNEQLRENISFGGIMLSILLLTVLTMIYSGAYIIFDNSFSLKESWPDIKIFFFSSLPFIAGWSAGISILLKFILPK